MNQLKKALIYRYNPINKNPKRSPQNNGYHKHKDKLNHDNLENLKKEVKKLKKTVRSLEDSQRNYKKIFENSPTGVYRTSPDGKILMANTAIIKMFGYLPSKKLSDYNLEENWHSSFPRSKFKKIIAEKDEIKGLEYAWEKQDNTIIFLRENARTARDKNGNILYYEGTIEDITKQKLAEEQLEKSEKRFRALIEKTSDAITLIDAKGKNLYASPSTSRILGYTPEEFLRQKPFSLVHPDNQKFIDNLLSELIKTPNKSMSGQYRLKHKNGSWRWVEFVATNLLGEPSVKAIVINYYDITERKNLEKRKDEFLSIASHELKTPLTSIKAFAQVLQKHFEKLGDKKSAQYLVKMDAQLTKLTELIHDLLDVSRIQDGKLIFKIINFNLDELINEIIEEMQRTTIQHHIIKKGEITKNIFADRERVGQVIINLLSNAIKYSPNSATIIVNISEDKQNVTISVQDFGIGISKENQKKVFERFFRVETPYGEMFPGLGVGLYISAQIIKRHKGKIWVKSKKRKGSTFYFKLPISLKNDNIDNNE